MDSGQALRLPALRQAQDRRRGFAPLHTPYFLNLLISLAVCCAARGWRETQRSGHARLTCGRSSIGESEVTESNLRSVRAALASVLLVGVLAGCARAHEAAPTATATAESGEMRVVVASQDLAVGENRFVFGVLDTRSRPVRLPEARTAFVFLETTPAETRAQGTAEFVRWPSGAAGVYVTKVAFDQAGRWGVVVEVAGGQGTAGFVVKAESSSPGIGQAAPASVNKTARDVAELAELTTAPVPDPDLYQTTIAEAISSGRPTVVTFGTPAYCETATCGPQVEVVSSLKDDHKGEANFIHVEVFDNPKEMEGDLSKGRYTPLVQEWGLPSEPFTFVLDGTGLIAAKFEGFVTRGELEGALVEVLGR